MVAKQAPDVCLADGPRLRRARVKNPKQPDTFLRVPGAAAATAAATALVLVIICASLMTSCQVSAQYYQRAAEHNYGGHQGGYDSAPSAAGEPEEFEGPEDRPKVRLGIRLRIPAFKFELPRFSLPKITVSAKIRQPDGPRVIRLPEINLDTSSRLEPPGGRPAGASNGGGGGGGHPYAYQTGASHGAPAYSGGGGGGQSGRSNTFTFSTGEENEHSGANYGPVRQNYAHQAHADASKVAVATNYQLATRQQVAAYQWPRSRLPGKQQLGAMSYSSASAQPVYSIHRWAPAGGGQLPLSSAGYQMEPQVSGSSSGQPELGFDAIPTFSSSSSGGGGGGVRGAALYSNSEAML